MKKLGLLAAVVLGAISTPTLAAWDTIGTVDFDRGGDKARAYTNFGGPVERLSLAVTSNDVECRRVTATFDNGKTRKVFEGWIRRGTIATIDLPGAERTVRRLDFDCAALGRREARITIGAELGRYRDVWTRNPAWANFFPRPPQGPGPGWGPGRPGRPGDDVDGWVRLGRESFEGRRDREAVFTGWAGRNVDAIALRAANGDAQCTRVRVTFGNGRTRDLDIGNRGVLRMGDFRRIDLPGRERNIRSLDMRCRPVGDRQVTIQAFARK
jgi:hypothetical protein